MKRKILLLWIVGALFASSMALYAKEYKVAIKQLPTSEFFSKVVKTIVEATGNTVVIQVVPPARADYLVSNKEVDIQMPIVIIPDVAKHKALPYDYATVILYKLSWVLYTNKDKPIDIKSLTKDNPNKYKIEIDPSRRDDYVFPTIGSSNYEASFKKLSEGTIDGIILSQSTGDPVLIKSGFKNISRRLWSDLDATFSLQKGMRGGEVDTMLSDGIKKLKANGTYEKLMGDYLKKAKYDNWQP